MTLTGKALEDFNKWNYDDDFGYIDCEPTSLVVHFVNLDENLRNTIIIEWFDIVGIYIEIKADVYTVVGIGDKCDFYIKIGKKLFYEPMYRSRKEAIEQAIIKANEIYNASFEKARA